MKPRNTLLTIMIMAVIFISCHETPVMALGTWTTGVITHRAWKDDQVRIEVDGIKYMLMPDAGVSLRQKRRDGAFDELPVSVQSLQKGQDVMMLVLGHNVYQIIGY